MSISAEIIPICLTEIAKRCPQATRAQLKRAAELLRKMPKPAGRNELCDACEWFVTAYCERLDSMNTVNTANNMSTNRSGMIGAVHENPAVVIHEAQMNVLYNVAQESGFRAQIAAIDIHNFLGFRSPADLQLAFNPQSLYQYHYVALDSRYRNRATSSATEYSWLYSPQIQQPPAGMIMSNLPIVNIVAMRLYRVAMPRNFIGYDRAANVTRTLTALVKEFDTQIVAFSGRLRYHFLGQYFEPEGDKPGIVSDDPQGMTFYFRQPIRYLDSITLSFGNPDQVISFYEDMYEATVSYSSPDIIFTTAVNVPAMQLVGFPWARVYIHNFTMTNPDTEANKAVIEEVNSLQGILLGRTGLNIFTLDNKPGLTDIIDGLKVQMYFIGLELVTYMEFVTIPEA